MRPRLYRPAETLQLDAKHIVFADRDSQQFIAALVSVVVVRVRPVSAVFRVTFTPGTAAPLGSVTVTRMVPVASAIAGPCMQKKIDTQSARMLVKPCLFIPGPLCSCCWEAVLSISNTASEQTESHEDRGLFHRLPRTAASPQCRRVAQRSDG